MEVIAVRSMTVNGRNYAPGDPIVDLPADKRAQLIAQRWVRAKDEQVQQYTMLRNCTIGGKTYVRGQKVKVTKLTSQKLAQMLENRWLEPVA